MNQISQGDTIESILIEGDIEALLGQHAETIAAWNDMLDEHFPKLASDN